MIDGEEIGTGLVNGTIENVTGTGATMIAGTDEITTGRGRGDTVNVRMVGIGTGREVTIGITGDGTTGEEIDTPVEAVPMGTTDDGLGALPVA